MLGYLYDITNINEMILRLFDLSSASRLCLTSQYNGAEINGSSLHQRGGIQGPPLHKRLSGPWFNIKMPSYQFRKSHYGDKTVVRSSYLQNRISYTGKTASLYWIRVLGPVSLTFIVRNSNSKETSSCCNSAAGDQIATNICTCHDSTAVVPSPKFCSNHCIRIEVRV